MKLDNSTDPQVGYRPPGPLEAGALDRYRGHFGSRQAAHLVRRAGFGGTPDDVERLAELGADRALDAVLHPAEPDLPFPDSPDPAELYDIQLRVKNQAAQMWYLDRLLRTRRPLVEKMTLFWHGHFATSLISSKVAPAQMVEQINLFRAQGLGSFGTLLRSVTYDPAMLVWLDNRKNVAAHPNENYARELMELFTLGLGNYTEDDVKNAARALTGITLAAGSRVVFQPRLHDADVKTFLGRTGNFGPDDIVDIVLAQPVHQRFICRKLLEFFVYSDPEPELVEELASVYATSGFDIGKTVGTILRSNVFFSPRAYRALPKSPIEFVIGLQRYMQFPQVPLDTLTWLGRMGQIPLMPQTVKGWDGGPTWINTSTMLARMNYVNEVVHAQKSAAAAAPGTGSATMAAGAGGASMPSASSSVGTSMSPASTGPAMNGTTVSTMPKFPSSLPSMRDPGAIVASAGGLHAERVLDAVLGGVVQRDVTSDLRGTLLAYLDGVNTDNPQPFGPETFELRTRGLLALVFTLPANNLN